MSERQPPEATHGQDPLDHPDEAGAYIGHEPERVADTIDVPLDPDDERLSATDSRSSGVGAADSRLQERGPVEGHRQGARVTDDVRREAGEDR